MQQHTGAIKEQGRPALHLGTLVCRRCGAIIDTLPTDGVKLFYGDCGNELCIRREGDEADEYN
jgi:hypothetical protein